MPRIKKHNATAELPILNQQVLQRIPELGWLTCQWNKGLSAYRIMNEASEFKQAVSSARYLVVGVVLPDTESAHVALGKQAPAQIMLNGQVENPGQS